MRTSIRLRHVGMILSTMPFVALLTGQPAMPQNNDQAELLFQFFMNKEMVSGDLEREISFNPLDTSVPLRQHAGATRLQRQCQVAWRRNRGWFPVASAQPDCFGERVSGEKGD
jgi:hypothetical protein